jgi:hypothetical protein
LISVIAQALAFKGLAMIEIVDYNNQDNLQEVLNKGLLEITINNCSCGQTAAAIFLILEDAGLVLLENQFLTLIE